MAALLDYHFIKAHVKKLPYGFVKSKLALPLQEKDGELLVAITDSLALDTLEEIVALTGLKVRAIVVAKESIEKSIEACYHQSASDASDYIQQFQGEEKEQLEGYDLLDQQEDSPVVRIINMILTEAIQQHVSDVHIEPIETGLQIRYRIDGVLQPRHFPPKDMHKQLVTRIKVMAKLDIAETRAPQDGRIKLRLGGRVIDFRVSTIPVVYGERIVLRILDKGNITLGLDKLGIQSNLLKQLRKLIRCSQGIILVTGPTGSGKTTTLYSALSEINASDLNIMTIEDPVEYKLASMAQIGVTKKLSFAKGLRSILRQDPDVIMVGEIRDRETAEIAIQASLTGHLVLSTLHTNDAPSALTRLVDMGIESYLLSSSVLAVLAQRLVRSLCPACKKSYLPTKEECADLGMAEVKSPIYEKVGCDSCFQSGYKGRIGVYELMEMTPSIKHQLLSSADGGKLKDVALQEGMQTLQQMGGELVLKGLTSSYELLRVTRQL